MVMAVYSVLLTAVLVVGSPWWLWRMATSGRYRAGLRGRLGFVPAELTRTAADRDVVWVHCVSVGEVLGAARLIGELQTALPGWVIAVSTTTQTGQEVARQKLAGIPVFYMPLDLGWIVRRYLRVLRPKLMVLMESELWPRLLVECSKRSIPVAVVNARVSDRSFPRYMRLRALWKPLLARVTVFLAQSEETAERLRAIGAPVQRVRVVGNLKFDIEPGETPMVRVLRSLLDRRTLIVAGSLLDPEEETVLNLKWRLFRGAPEFVLLLAPRHRERFSVVAALAERVPHFGSRRYLASELLQQSTSKQPLTKLPPQAVVVLDTIGDLAAVYALADVAFVGGSLSNHGGHNPLEPARFGVPVVIGPSYENFRDIVQGMIDADGIRIVQDRSELETVLLALLSDPQAAKAMGARGRTVFEARTGATRRTVNALLDLLPEGAA